MTKEIIFYLDFQKFRVKRGGIEIYLHETWLPVATLTGYDA
jgi:hypothetical protein